MEEVEKKRCFRVFREHDHFATTSAAIALWEELELLENPTDRTYWSPDAETLGNAYGAGRFLFWGADTDYPTPRELVVVGRTRYEEREEPDGETPELVEGLPVEA